MTIISEPVSTIAHADNSTAFVFAVPILRENDTGTGMITTRAEHVYPQAGVLTTPDLDAGPATVQIGIRQYAILIPDSPTPVRLMPLIEAGLPVIPAEEIGAVRNAGGVGRTKRVTLAEFLAMPTPDPDTLYVVI